MAAICRASSARATGSPSSSERESVARATGLGEAAGDARTARVHDREQRATCALLIREAREAACELDERARIRPHRGARLRGLDEQRDRLGRADARGSLDAADALVGIGRREGGERRSRCRRARARSSAPLRPAPRSLPAAGGVRREGGEGCADATSANPVAATKTSAARARDLMASWAGERERGRGRVPRRAPTASARARGEDQERDPRLGLGLLLDGVPRHRLGHAVAMRVRREHANDRERPRERVHLRGAGVARGAHARRRASSRGGD